MYGTKNNGPKMLPCRAPDKTGRKSEQLLMTHTMHIDGDGISRP